MNKKRSIFIAAVIACLFCSCMGDHGSNHGKDTEKSDYGQIARDTNRLDSSDTDTASLDNSGSGGTKIPKPDSPKNK